MSNKNPVHLIAPEEASNVIEVILLPAGEDACAGLSEREKNLAAHAGFKGKAGDILLIPGDDGTLERVYFGSPDSSKERSSLNYAPLLRKLPAGTYQFSEEPRDIEMIALGFLLDAYRFTKYLKSKEQEPIRFVIKNDKARVAALRMGEAATFTRDLINTPTNDMGPSQLAKEAKALAARYGADFKEIVGDDLLTQNFPMIHAVGRASVDAPRLIDFTWGDDAHPKVTLVGKGVCFDTGGLNIKTGSFMTLMKKDMGGAANVLGLAQMIMDAKLPVRLRVLIPAVENAIAGNAFRPGDILPSRLGLSVEIANTDAEGRLVLADALAYGDEEAPDLMIDMATLTGAARVALGPDLPPFYCNDDAFADELMVRARDMADPVWRMPLWSPYQTMLDTPIADVNHAPSGGFAGSITAALFLQRFVKSAATWAHFDIYGWTPTAKPARPKGGEAQAIRAIYGLLSAKYG